MDDYTILNAIRSLKANFWSENHGLPEAELQELWNHRMANLAKELGANPTGDVDASIPQKRPGPTTNTFGGSRPSKRRITVSEAPQLQRHLSAPVPERKRSRSSKTNSGPNPALPCTESTLSHPIDIVVNKPSARWPVPLASGPASASHSLPIPAHPQPATRPSIANCQDLSPNDWLSQTAYLSQSPDDFHMPSLSVTPSPIVAHGEFQPQDLSRLSAWVAAGSAWDHYSMSRSVSDSGMTNASTVTSEAASQSMTRCTTDETLVEPLQMCRVGSVNSNISEFGLSGDSTMTNDYSSFDFCHFPEFDPVVENSLPHVSKNSFSSLSTSESRSQSLPNGSVIMLPSLSQESNATNSSSDSFQPSRPRKGQEKHAPSRRPLAPKTPSKNRSSSTQAPKMVEFVTADGTRQTKAQISRACRTPKETTKVYCYLCNDHGEGFHGDHELRRHIERAHSKFQKVWICKDISPDGKFLANCKHCRNRKAYGANYNAAAHLRRVHFKPCETPKGGRGKVSQNRGGIGGGTDPPMEVLRDWMFETDNINLNGLMLGTSQVSDTTYMSSEQPSSSSANLQLEMGSVGISDMDIDYAQQVTNLDMSYLPYTTDETCLPTATNNLTVTQPDLLSFDAVFVN